jgi:hypothetical protein
MYGDITSTADTVTNWTSLGVKLPDDLAKAVELYEAIRYTEVGYVPTFDIEKLTPKNAEAEIRKLAGQLVLADPQHDASGNLSILEKAKRQVLDAAARQVVGLGRHAIPDVIEQLTPEFDRQAVAYAEAIRSLPEKITSDTLITAGAPVVSAWRAAQDAASYLDRISGWVASTGPITGVLAKQMESVIRILRPETAVQLGRLDTASHSQPDKALAVLKPVYVTAVRLGIPFGINTLREAAQLRTELETVRPQQLQGVALTNA